MRSLSPKSPQAAIGLVRLPPVPTRQYGFRKRWSIYPRPSKIWQTSFAAMQHGSEPPCANRRNIPLRGRVNLPGGALQSTGTLISDDRASMQGALVNLVRDDGTPDLFRVALAGTFPAALSKSGRIVELRAVAL